MQGTVFTGHIQLILGPMFSGKSSELVRRIRRYTVAKKNCVIVKYSRDTRYGDAESLATHDKLLVPALACDALAEVEPLIGPYEVVGIDEGQFFPDVVDFCEKMANLGKVVIVASLDGTFQRKPFGQILDLIPRSEVVDKLTALCVNCFEPASFSKRVSDEKELQVIGGADKYIAVCRQCYFSDNDSTGSVGSDPESSPEGTRPHAGSPCESPRVNAIRPFWGVKV